MRRVCLLLALLCCVAVVHAQEWTPAQKEVLKAFDSCMKAVPTVLGSSYFSVEEGKP